MSSQRKWGLIVINKDMNGTIAKMDDKEKIIQQENFPDLTNKIGRKFFKLFAWMKQSKEDKCQYLDDINKTADKYFLSGRNSTSLVKGIFISCPKEVDVRASLSDKLKPLVLAQYTVYSLEQLIKKSKDERDKYNQAHGVEESADNSFVYVSNTPALENQGSENSKIEIHQDLEEQMKIPAEHQESIQELKNLIQKKDDIIQRLEDQQKIQVEHHQSSQQQFDQQRHQEVHSEIQQQQNQMEQEIQELKREILTKDETIQDMEEQMKIPAEHQESSQLQLQHPNKTQESQPEQKIQELNKIIQKKDDIIQRLEDQQKIQAEHHQSSQQQFDQQRHQETPQQNQKQPPQSKEQHQQPLENQQNQHKYQENKFKEKDESVILCKIVPPPPQVSAIHEQIINVLEQRLTSEGFHMSEGESGLSVVVAVNNSRIASDVKRDLAKTGLKDVPILLLIIKATRNINTKPYIQIRDLEDSRIKEVCFFLVDANLTALHKCQINNDSFNCVTNFLKNF